MIKKNKFLLKVAAALIVYASIIPTNASWLAIGEPELPKKIIKKDDMVL